MLQLVLLQLLRAGCFSGFALSARDEDKDEIATLLKTVVPNHRSIVVTGGSTRQESVHNALRAVEGWAEIVAVHDAARPFCRTEITQAVVEAAGKSGAAIVALPITSTIKEGSLEAGVRGTISREQKWLAQTPQAFRYQLLRDAFEEARKIGFDATDESQLFERTGQRVEIVPGDPLNIKITTPEDLVLARQITGMFLNQGTLDK